MTFQIKKLLIDQQLFIIDSGIEQGFSVVPEPHLLHPFQKFRKISGRNNLVHILLLKPGKLQFPYPQKEAAVLVA